jgi:hypothetical protein
MKHRIARGSPRGTVRQPGPHGTVRCRVCLKTVSPGESMLEVPGRSLPRLLPVLRHEVQGVPGRVSFR